MAITVTEGEPRKLRMPFATSMRWQGKLATAFKERRNGPSSAALVPRTSRRPSLAHPDWSARSGYLLMLSLWGTPSRDSSVRHRRCLNRVD
jgi:hypothetical protein